MSSSPRLTFVDAVADGFRKWRTFDGRASRTAFWYWMLFVVLVGLVLMTLDAFLFPATPLPDIPSDPTLYSGADVRNVLDLTIADTFRSTGTFASLALLVPTIAVTVRRFRDAGSPTVFAWLIHLANPVSTVVVFWLGYIVADILDAGTTNPSDAATMLILVLVLLGLAAANVTAFIVLIALGVRPTRSL